MVLDLYEAKCACLDEFQHCAWLTQVHADREDEYGTGHAAYVSRRQEGWEMLHGRAWRAH